MGISTHILDTALGRPATNVAVALAQWKNNAWALLNGTNTDGAATDNATTDSATTDCATTDSATTDCATTDTDGRINFLLPADRPLYPGLFRLRFYTAAYYQAQGMNGLYPYIDVVFETRAGEPHYHIPLLLTPNSYSTYRGS